MNFNEKDLWREKTELLNLRLSKLVSAKVLLELKFDAKDQVLLISLGLGLRLITKMGLNTHHPPPHPPPPPTHHPPTTNF